MLTKVFRTKILCTVVLWALPLSLFPASWFVRMGMPEPRPLLFFRLLGAAYSALVVEYGLGLRRLSQGAAARDTIWVGVASNGSASLILLLCGVAGRWKGWGKWARMYMWGSAIVTASIALGLVVTGLLRDNR